MVLQEVLHDMERQDSFDRMLDGLEFEGLDEINDKINAILQEPFIVPHLHQPCVDNSTITNIFEAHTYLMVNGFPEGHVATKCIMGTFAKDEWLSVEEVREIVQLCDQHPRIASLMCIGAPNVAAKGLGTAAFKDAASKQQMLRNLAMRGGIDMVFMWRLVALDGDRSCAMCKQPSHTIPKNGVYCTKCSHKVNSMSV